VKATKRIRDLKRRVKRFFKKEPKEPKEPSVQTIEETKIEVPEPKPLTIAEELEELFRNYKPKKKEKL